MEWKDIEGFEGLYQVSDTGDVRSLDRVCGGRRNRKLKGVVLKKTKTSTGYWKVELSKDGKVYRKKVHRLVASAFIDNPLNKPNVNHIDNDPLNNCVKNLEWCTQAENVLHAHRIGAIKRNRHGKLDELAEGAMKEHIPYSREHSYRAIAERLGVNPGSLYGAVKRWETRSYL